MNHGERSKNHVNAQNVDAVLSALKGATVTRVSIECWSVRMLLGDAELIIEAEWELYNSAGEIVDTSLPLKSRRAFEIWKLTGETVVDTSLLHSMSTVLTINFSNN